ncbi:MAG: monovalent cation/H(+) antiporter subunit G [Candidatus Latescibacterota bacterium]|nr:monovalent cation/H(+) antiporter subunit G [Candidatus Latescibacterota bacterium]
MDHLLFYLSWILIVIGSLFACIGGIGLLRFPDFFSRQHAAGITDTLGAGSLLLGLMIQGGPTLVTVKLLMVFVFLLITSPVATHAIAQAAKKSGLKPKLTPSIHREK